MAGPRLLICYDGSAGAAAALAAAGRLFPGAHATVTYAWSRPLPFGGMDWGGQIVLPPEVQRNVEDQMRDQATALVRDAAEEARQAGLDTQPDARETTRAAWRELLEAADDFDADVIVAGSRGRGEMRALVLGSTSQALAHHSRRPLLIVPAPPA